MHCNKSFIQLSLFIVLGLFSCKKEKISSFQDTLAPTSPTDLPNPNEEIKIQTTKVITEIADESNIPKHQLVIEVESVIRNLTFGSLLQTAFYPQVYGFNNSIATTRTGCPESNLSTNNSSSPTVHTITLDYGSGCTSFGGTNYEGIASLSIIGDLNEIGTFVSIELSEDFTINSINDLDGIISLEYDIVNGVGTYKIIDLDLQNTNIQNSNITTVNLSQDVNLAGGFFIKPNYAGDPGNPLDIINDTLSYAGCFQIISPDGQTLRSCTDSNADINYDFSCAIPFDGLLIIDSLNNDGSFGDPNIPNGGTFGELNFSYPNSINNGVCDDEIEFSDSVTGTSEIINL